MINTGPGKMVQSAKHLLRMHEDQSSDLQGKLGRHGGRPVATGQEAKTGIFGASWLASLAIRDPASVYNV